MKLTFNLTNVSVDLDLPDNAKYRSQLLNQNGNFGLKSNTDDAELAIAIVKNYTPILDRLIKYLPKLDNITILDIGSGNSIIDLVIGKIFPNATFILLDGDESNNNPILHSVKFKPYNKWIHVSDTITLNHLDADRFKFVGLDYDFKDLLQYVISYGSCGLHYPVETYISKIQSALDIDGMVLFGPILNINSQLQAMDHLFKPIELIELLNFANRATNQMTAWQEHFPTNFVGTFAHAGVWQKR